MSARVAVIGAGIAGLAAAYRLKQAGLAPAIFEKESFVGGRMSSESTDGFIIDKAAYTFPEYHTNLTSFLGELGMKTALVRTPGTSRTYAGGKAYEVKIGSPADFLKYKLLSLKNKKDMIKLFLYAQALGSALNMMSPTKKTFELEREMASDYILGSYDNEILEHVAWPIFCEILLGNPEDNSKVPFLATLKNLTWFKIFSFSHGMGMLPERLANELDVRLDSPVNAVRSASGGGGYEVEIGGVHPEKSVFDGVIFTVPSPLVPEILEDLTSGSRKLLQEIQYSKSIVAAFALEGAFDRTAMINNLSRDMFKTVGTIVFDNHKGPRRAPEGKELVTAILCEKASRGLMDEAEERVTSAVIEEVDSLFPGFADRVIFSRVYRWPYGAVQFPPGATLRHDEARRNLDREFRRICFAGDGLHKTSLEVSFNTGVQAANRLIKELAA